MRISERGMTRNVLSDLMANRTRLSRLQEQLSSGSRINRPSDDPGGTMRVMQIKSTLEEIEGFRSNASAAHDWMSATESTLAEISDVVQHVRELAVRGSTDALPQESRDALADEVTESLDHLFSLANSQHVGRYLFGGYKSDEAPYGGDAGTGFTYSGDSGSITRKIGPDVEIQMNVPGTWGATAEDAPGFLEKLLNTTAQVRDDLSSGDLDAVNDGIVDLDERQDEVLSARSSLGSRMNRLQMSENRLEDMDLSLKRMLSETADVDIAEAVMNLNMTERAYNVTLATGARILPQTLLDYLR
ncbi:MAG: flagellar hook-associated protein FlgL [Bacillota bacterium]